MTDRDHIINDYFLTNSPLSDLANKPSGKTKNLRNEVDTKINLLTSKTKNYLPEIRNSASGYSDMKATSTVFKLP